MSKEWIIAPPHPRCEQIASQLKVTRAVAAALLNRGLDEAKRRQWHQLFEQRYPQAHQGFLEWLGLDAQKIKDVRSKS